MDDAVRKVVFAAGYLDSQYIVRFGKINVSNHIANLDFQIILSVD